MQLQLRQTITLFLTICYLHEGFLVGWLVGNSSGFLGGFLVVCVLVFLVSFLVVLFCLFLLLVFVLINILAQKVVELNYKRSDRKTCMTHHLLME